MKELTVWERVRFSLSRWKPCGQSPGIYGEKSREKLYDRGRRFFRKHSQSNKTIRDFQYDPSFEGNETFDGPRSGPTFEGAQPPKQSPSRTRHPQGVVLRKGSGLRHHPLVLHPSSSGVPEVGLRGRFVVDRRGFYKIWS